MTGSATIESELLLPPSLNEQQRLAITSDPTHSLLVLAGAGTGKTTTLCHRISYLVRHFKIPASKILAVTFTNKAAEELRDRVNQVMGEQEGAFLTVKEAGIDWNIVKICPESQSKKIIQNAMRIGGATTGRACSCNSVSTMAEAFAKWKSIGAVDTQNTADSVAFETYQREMHAGQWIDFADMIGRSAELLRVRPDVLDRLRERYQYVFVDEFQDTSAVQYDLVRRLCEHAGRVTVVGDDDQSIYSFRGANVKNFALFRRDFSPLTVRLEMNYRCTQHILNVAKMIVEENNEREGKMLTTIKEGKRVCVRQCDTVQDEAEWICNKIQHLRAKHPEFRKSRIAILYRSLKTDAEVVQKMLSEKGITCRVAGNSNIAESPQLTDILSYLRLLTDEKDDRSFERIVNVPSRGIGSTTIEGLQATATARNCSLWSAAQYQLKSDGLNKAQRTKLQAFIQLIASWRKKAVNMTPVEILERILKETQYVDNHLSKRAKAVVSRIEATQGSTGTKDSSMKDDVTQQEDDDSRTQFTQLSASLKQFSSTADKENPEYQLQLQKLLLPLVTLQRQAERFVNENEGHQFQQQRETEKKNQEEISLSSGADDIIQFYTGQTNTSSTAPLPVRVPSTSAIVDTVSKSLTTGLSALKQFLSSLGDVSQEVDVDKDEESNAAGGEQQQTTGSVLLMTVHKAKGLEWPIVFIPAWNDRIFPSRSASDEERRVAHVAVTRAMDRLYISYSTDRGVISPFTLPEADIRHSRQTPLPLPTSRVSLLGNIHQLHNKQQQFSNGASGGGVGFVTARDFLKTAAPMDKHLQVKSSAPVLQGKRGYGELSASDSDLGSVPFAPFSKKKVGPSSSTSSSFAAPSQTNPTVNLSSFFSSLPRHATVSNTSASVSAADTYAKQAALMFGEEDGEEHTLSNDVSDLDPISMEISHRDGVTDDFELAEKGLGKVHAPAFTFTGFKVASQIISTSSGKRKEFLAPFSSSSGLSSLSGKSRPLSSVSTGSQATTIPSSLASSISPAPMTTTTTTTATAAAGNMDRFVPSSALSSNLVAKQPPSSSSSGLLASHLYDLTESQRADTPLSQSQKGFQTASQLQLAASRQTPEELLSSGRRSSTKHLLPSQSSMEGSMRTQLSVPDTPLLSETPVPSSLLTQTRIPETQLVPETQLEEKCVNEPSEEQAAKEEEDESESVAMRMTTQTISKPRDDDNDDESMETQEIVRQQHHSASETETVDMSVISSSKHQLVKNLVIAPDTSLDLESADVPPVGKSAFSLRRVRPKVVSSPPPSDAVIVVDDDTPQKQPASTSTSSTLSVRKSNTLLVSESEDSRLSTISSSVSHSAAAADSTSALPVGAVSFSNLPSLISSTPSLTDTTTTSTIISTTKGVGAGVMKPRSRLGKSAVAASRQRLHTNIAPPPPPPPPSAVVLTQPSSLTATPSMAESMSDFTSASRVTSTTTTSLYQVDSDEEEANAVATTTRKRKQHTDSEMSDSGKSLVQSVSTKVGARRGRPKKASESETKGKGQTLISKFFGGGGQ